MSVFLVHSHQYYSEKTPSSPWPPSGKLHTPPPTCNANTSECSKDSSSRKKWTNWPLKRCVDFEIDTNASSPLRTSTHLYPHVLLSPPASHLHTSYHLSSPVLTSPPLFISSLISPRSSPLTLYHLSSSPLTCTPHTAQHFTINVTAPHFVVEDVRSCRHVGHCRRLTSPHSCHITLFESTTL